MGSVTNAPRTHQPTRRQVLAGGAGLAALLLGAGGCGALTLPSADDALMRMRALASRDAAALQGPAAQVRAAHAEALGAEITRSCGTRDDGSAPEGCGEAPAAPAPPSGAAPEEQLLGARLDPDLVEALDGRTLRQDYNALLAAAVDGGIVLAARGLDVDWEDLVPAKPTGDIGGKDADLLASALEAEYALVYGMGVAAPRIDAEFQVSAGTSADRHRLLRDRVIAALDDAGRDIPPSSPGYAIADGAPDPDVDAAAFAGHLESAAADAWRHVLREASATAVRMTALGAAGLAQAGAAVFAGDGTAALPGLGA